MRGSTKSTAKAAAAGGGGARAGGSDKHKRPSRSRKAAAAVAAAAAAASSPSAAQTLASRSPSSLENDKEAGGDGHDDDAAAATGMRSKLTAMHARYGAQLNFLVVEFTKMEVQLSLEVGGATVSCALVVAVVVSCFSLCVSLTAGSEGWIVDKARKSMRYLSAFYYLATRTREAFFFSAFLASVWHVLPKRPVCFRVCTYVLYMIYVYTIHDI